MKNSREKIIPPPFPPKNREKTFAKTQKGQHASQLSKTLFPPVFLYFPHLKNWIEIHFQ